MTFAIALPLKPISAQKKGKKTRFQETIRNGARSRMGGASLLAGELYARITWFHATDPKIDIDNIVKPILDTLIGIVYEDDRRIAQCLATRIKSRPKPRLSKAHISEADREQLDKLITNNEHVLYIEVGGMPLRKVIFGPIDGP